MPREQGSPKGRGAGVNGKTKDQQKKAPARKKVGSKRAPAKGKRATSGKKAGPKRTGTVRKGSRSVKVRKKTGRPSKYSPAVLKKICDKLSIGIPMTIICEEEGMPKSNTVREWIRQDEKVISDGGEGKGVSAAIARAREEGFDHIAQECLDIADDKSKDFIERDGRMVVDKEHVQRSRLRIDTRLKLLAKWDPKRYGEKIAVEGKGFGDMVVKYAFALPEEAKDVEDWTKAIEGEVVHDK